MGYINENSMPVPCCECDEIVDLNDCYFPRREDPTFGVCPACYQRLQEEQQRLEDAMESGEYGS